MRLRQSFEGLRARIAQVDSSGSSIGELLDLSLPVFVVGFDEGDQSRLVLGGTNVSSVAPNFSWVGIFSARDFWIETLLTADGGSVRKLLKLLQGLPTVAYIDSPSPWVRTPTDITMIESPAGGSPVLPVAPGTLGRFTVNDLASGSGATNFNRPGLLVPAGVTAIVQSQFAGDDFSLYVTARET